SASSSRRSLASAPALIRPLRPPTQTRSDRRKPAMLDFAQLPPEINSGLMYSGAGAAPMLAAAAAWEGLATELRTTASSFRSLVTGLTDGPWQGPAAASMAA